MCGGIKKSIGEKLPDTGKVESERGGCMVCIAVVAAAASLAGSGKCEIARFLGLI